MTEHSLWGFSRALYRGINERQREDLEALLDDDVEWAIYGPIDMFPFLGARRGRAAVLEVIRQIAENVRVHRFDRESIMLGVELGGLDDALFTDGAGFEQADQAAARPFRAIQGRPAGEHPRARRYLGPGGAGARASNKSAEARVIVIV
jgi:ketosteroid isomerase-like protein